LKWRHATTALGLDQGETRNAGPGRQMRTWATSDNISGAGKLARNTHAKGRQVVLLQESFLTPYFSNEGLSNLGLARPAGD
jgi:predicted amidohydrolase